LLPAVLSNQRYRPYAHNPGLAYAAPYRHEQALTQPACEAIVQNVQHALPVLALFQQSQATPYPLDPAIIPLLNSVTMSGELRSQLKKVGIVLSQNGSIQPIGNGKIWELHDILRKRHWLIEPIDGQLYMLAFKQWTLQRDLLDSSPYSYDYTVDIEDDRRARLRFSYQQQSLRPMPGERFRITYRSGGGIPGNVLADTIKHLVSSDRRIIGIRNPLRAQGGSDPEAIVSARTDAPYAFRTQQRCVTEDDYAAIAMRYPHVLKAVTRLRQVGNRPTTYIYVQRDKGRAVDAAFATNLSRYLQDFCLINHTFEVRGAYYVALQIALKVTIQAHATRSIVSTALMEAFANKAGGFFYPDNFTFGQDVYQSQVITRAMSIPGVMQVEVIEFRRLDTASSSPVDAIHLQPLEIAQLNNDEAAPQNGMIALRLEGSL
jgi:hypothetical protein